MLSESRRSCVFVCFNRMLFSFVSLSNKADSNFCSRSPSKHAIFVHLTWNSIFSFHLLRAFKLNSVQLQMAQLIRSTTLQAQICLCRLLLRAWKTVSSVYAIAPSNWFPDDETWQFAYRYVKLSFECFLLCAMLFQKIGDDFSSELPVFWSVSLSVVKMVVVLIWEDAEEIVLWFVMC